MTDPAPVLIEAAINGGTTKDRNPHVPLTPAEIRADAEAALDAGATIIHAHNHDIRLSGEPAARAYLDAWAPLLADRPDVLWYPTLCVAPDPAAKLEHVRMIAEQVPLTMAAVDPGSTNLGSPGTDGLPEGGVYANSYGDIRQSFDICAAHGLGPQLAIYEPGFLQCVLTYHRAGRLPTGSMVKLYFGGEWGMWRAARGSPSACLRRAMPCSPTSTCSRGPDCHGRCRCGAGTSWRRRWPGSRSSAAGTYTSASRSTSILPARRPTSSSSARRWRSSSRWGARSPPPPMRSGSCSSLRRQ